MSGTSYTDDCPQCNTKESYMCYSDLKHDEFDGICLECGFHKYTNTEYLDEEILEEERKEFNYTEVSE